MPDRYVNWPPPVEALIPLAQELGRVSAKACHDLGIDFDMDDPEVAREVMMVTFEAPFLSKPKSLSRTRNEPPTRRTNGKAQTIPANCTGNEPLPDPVDNAIGATMDENITATILHVLERTPQWLRHDLEGKDAAARTRAEETLAAMISTALAEATGKSQAT
ncbi:hypothetical protein [Sphingobium sp. Sx8-8]|uniref:hypothetical protein n=1 Tax=Sphingobium sp. Sx8-8 TaxID=2933617 RepID=UPI001F57C4FE|nr:hypothetical protein [Sphingobium sp. Sx8-8]